MIVAIDYVVPLSVKDEQAARAHLAAAWAARNGKAHIETVKTHGSFGSIEWKSVDG